jgi:YVTN family beta-propeller protein
MKLRTSDHAVVDTVAVGYEPLAAALLPGDRYLFVSNTNDDDVSVINTLSGEVVERLPAGDGTSNVQPLPNGEKVYVTNLIDNTVTVYGR